MNRKKLSIHKIGVAATLILFLSTVFVTSKLENSVCMGLQFIPQDKAAAVSLVTPQHHSEILFNGVPAAVDVINHTVYISQQIDSTTKASQLKGRFSTSTPAYQLVFEKDGEFDSLQQAVARGHSFSMLLLLDGTTAEKYNVVITTLPVMNINGVVIGNNKNRREIFDGSLVFWDSLAAETGSYRTENTHAQWSIRGQTSANQPKKPWKLSVKNSEGENNNISFCGLGEDDDWILNPMNLDDTKIREKLVMDLWNQTGADKNTDMSDGEYVELVFNGDYRGVFLLQRRVDEKHLALAERDILLKCSTYTNSIMPQDLEIVYSPYSDDVTMEKLAAIFPDGYMDAMVDDNLVDIAMFVQFGNMYDNLGSKNTFWLIQDIEGDCKVKTVLWDTDMSFGISIAEHFIYTPDFTMEDMAFRTEWLYHTQRNPQLNTVAAQKWFELRKTAFDRDNLVAMTDGYIEQLTQSGALQRDRNLWGEFYSGKDNYGSFVEYIDGRLAVLDEYYGQFVQ